MATAEKADASDKVIDKVMEYTPFGETHTVKLSIAIVREWLCKPTKSGKMPTDSDVMRYMQMSRARALNPWTGDCFLTGYDSEGGPQFSIITSVQAMLKRATASQVLNGFEAGVIVRANGQTINREGAWIDDGEAILGGWASVHRKDCAVPFRATVRFSVFNTNQSRWKKDPSGMIRKCALAAALREAFPLELGGLYSPEEFDSIETTATAVPKTGLAGVRDRLGLPAASPTIDIAPTVDAVEPEPEPVKRREKKTQNADVATLPPGDLAEAKRTLGKAATESTQALVAEEKRLLDSFTWTEEERDVLGFIVADAKEGV